MPIAHPSKGIQWKPAFSLVWIKLPTAQESLCLPCPLPGQDWLTFNSLVSNLQVLRNMKHIQMWIVLVIQTIIIIIPRKSWSQKVFSFTNKKAFILYPQLTYFHGGLLFDLPSLSFVCLRWVCFFIHEGCELTKDKLQEGKQMKFWLWIPSLLWQFQNCPFSKGS